MTTDAADSTRPRPGLWTGRAAILIGVVLLGITLRHAVTGLSPLLGDVLASWGLLSLVAVVPWGLQLAKLHRDKPNMAPAASTAPVTHKLGLRQLITNPVAVGTALFYAMASLNIYAMLAWLPTILQQHLGLDRDTAGFTFSIYTSMAVGGLMMDRPGRYLEDKLA